MSINLTKGGNANLSKEVKGLSKISVGLGWDVRKTDGDGFDLDASAFMLNSNGKCRNDKDFVFYNNLKSECGSVTHTGDNRTGAGDGDDESLKIDLSKVPNDVEKIQFVVTIHEADQRRQNFGMVSSSFIRVEDQKSNKEICRFDLTEDASTETSMIFGELYKKDDEWKFKAVGQGFKGGLSKMLEQVGLA
jgi:tellurium resistance protein TerD